PYLCHTDASCLCQAPSRSPCYSLALHDALPISSFSGRGAPALSDGTWILTVRQYPGGAVPECPQLSAVSANHGSDHLWEKYPDHDLLDGNRRSHCRGSGIPVADLPAASGLYENRRGDPDIRRFFRNLPY